MTLTFTNAPEPSVSEVFQAFRDLLPVYGDGRGGYLLKVVRNDNLSVLVSVGRLTVSHKSWKEEWLGDLVVYGDEDIPALIEARFPEFPRCPCGCGEYVRQEGIRHTSGSHNKGQLQEACKKGHPLTGDNVYVRPGSTDRECQECRRERREKSRLASR